MYDLTVDGEEPHEFTTIHMETGDIGKVVGGDWSGEVLLKTFRGLVSLTDPKRTWSGDNVPMSICLYKSGEVIKLTIK